MLKPNDYTEVPQDAPAVLPAENSRNREPWMSIPVGPNCPQGLEYLTVLDRLLVAQKVELLEVASGTEAKNRFKVKNSLGHNVYFAYEESNWLVRQICRGDRPFDIKILDNFQNEIIHLKRPFQCSSLFCLPGSLNLMKVLTPQGQVIGSIQKMFSFPKSKYIIKNVSGDVVLYIECPHRLWKCFTNVEMKVCSMNDEQIGLITKQWSGLATELFTDANYISMTFPLNLDVRMKALLLGAAFLIDILFFEN